SPAILSGVGEAGVFSGTDVASGGLVPERFANARSSTTRASKRGNGQAPLPPDAQQNSLELGIVSAPSEPISVDGERLNCGPVSSWTLSACFWSAFYSASFCSKARFSPRRCSWSGQSDAASLRGPRAARRCEQRAGLTRRRVVAPGAINDIALGDRVRY